LFRDVVALGTVWVIPVTCKDFTQDGVERLFDSPASHQLLLMGAGTQWICIRGLDVPTTQVELCHCYESLHWVVNLGNRKKCLRMCHEATHQSAYAPLVACNMLLHTLLCAPASIVVRE
jgi:hypothetical protein